VVELPCAATDAGKVLLRWKLDNHQYRVIFGDRLK